MLQLQPEFTAIDWSALPEERHSGTTGDAYWRIQIFNGVRVRRVRYTAGYLADHWCRRGHILHVLSGRLETELDDGTRVNLEAGMTYVVGTGGPAHRSSTGVETTLFIVDCDEQPIA